MNPSREELLLQLALSKPAAERAVFLDRECGDEKVLRQRLEALLAAHDAPAGVLGDPSARRVLAPTLELPEPVADEAVGSRRSRTRA